MAHWILGHRGVAVKVASVPSFTHPTMGFKITNGDGEVFAATHQYGTAFARTFDEVADLAFKQIEAAVR